MEIQTHGAPVGRRGAAEHVGTSVVPGLRVPDRHIDPRLLEWIAVLAESRRACLVLDAGHRLVWTSVELEGLIGGHDLVAEVAAGPRPDIFTGRFDRREGGLDPYEVRYLGTRLRNEIGRPIGSFIIAYMGLRPTLVSLLARGSEAMYERMAELVEPRRHQAAILFADLQGSCQLSRQLATPRYFELIRTLSTRFDRTVARERGVVGKHAGDGMCAFFLADAEAGPVDAASGALRTALDVRHWAAEMSEELSEEAPAGVLVNIALHWGTNLYVGQLVPGGRLDVTALGHEVNQCARLQESTHGGRISLSRAFAELLDPDEATALGIDLPKAAFRSLATLSGVTEKAIRDAGALSVSQL